MAMSKRNLYIHESEMTLPKNWGIGISNLKMLTGALLYQAGAEDLGTAVMERQAVELQKNTPYNR